MYVEYSSNKSGGRWALDEAVAEWEFILGKRSATPGCSCCGDPHSFTEYSDGGVWVQNTVNRRLARAAF